MNEKKQNYEILSEWGVLSSRPDKRSNGTIEIRLTKCSWFGKMPKWDLRNWTDDYAGPGIVIGNDDDLRKLRDMLISVCEQIN